MTEAELDSLETESSNNIDLKEFIPLSKIDPVYFESSYYLGAAKGEAVPAARRRAGQDRSRGHRQLVSRGKEQLVLIRPYENGLIMHGLYYADEVRDFGQIPKGENAKLSEQEITLGVNLIEQMADNFDPEKYRDEYRIRVLAMLDEKSKGREITVAPAPEPRHGQVIDLMQALKESMERARPKKKAAPAQKKRKKAS